MLRYHSMDSLIYCTNLLTYSDLSTLLSNYEEDINQYHSIQSSYSSSIADRQHHWWDSLSYSFIAFLHCIVASLSEHCPYSSPIQTPVMNDIQPHADTPPITPQSNTTEIVVSPEKKTRDLPKVKSILKTFKYYELIYHQSSLSIPYINSETQELIGAINVFAPLLLLPTSIIICHKWSPPSISLPFGHKFLHISY